jgi:hypothetical protein
MSKNIVETFKDNVLFQLMELAVHERYVKLNFNHGETVEKLNIIHVTIRGMIRNTAFILLGEEFQNVVDAIYERETFNTGFFSKDEIDEFFKNYLQKNTFGVEITNKIKETIDSYKYEYTEWQALEDLLSDYGDSAEAQAVKEYMKQVEKDDVGALVDLLSDDEFIFMEEELNNFLIEKDSACEREEAVAICSLLSWF